MYWFLFIFDKELKVGWGGWGRGSGMSRGKENMIKMYLNLKIVPNNLNDKNTVKKIQLN